MSWPWIQLAAELMDAAPELSVRLECNENDALAYSVRAIRWAVDRVPKHIKPSEFADVRGPKAAQLIARAAKYPGPPEEFCTAWCELPDPPLERTADGYRFRGLHRYDTTWKKNRGKPEDEPGGGGAETGGKPDGNRAETGGKSKSKTESKSKKPPPAAESEKPPAPEVAQLWGVMQEARCAELADLRVTPQPLKAGAAKRLQEAVENLGKDALFDAWCRCLAKRDEFSARCDPPYPGELFLDQLHEKWVRVEPTRPPPVACALCGGDKGGRGHAPVGGLHLCYGGCYGELLMAAEEGKWESSHQHAAEWIRVQRNAEAWIGAAVQRQGVSA